jgi:hypothetical protein
MSILAEENELDACACQNHHPPTRMTPPHLSKAQDSSIS